mmetsp:Transcript_2572/g.7713  ORF Transcript_2572/g.7713 Transcript_2572/m.7713 type:complete len:123 (-) Transcript_2572:2089-2457(-)
MNRRCCGSQAQARKKLTWVCHDSAFRETVVCTMTKLKVSEAEIQEVKDLVQYIRNANDMPPRVDTLEAVLAVAPKMDVELLVATSGTFNKLYREGVKLFASADAIFLHKCDQVCWWRSMPKA